MEIINIISGLLTPMIAILAVYIAYQQYLNGKKKIKLELYEKRYFIFKVTKKILLQINQDAIIEITELGKFKNTSNESKFLFNKDIMDYLSELSENAMKLSHLTEDLNKIEIYSTNSVDRNKKVEKRYMLIKWFTNEYENIENRFEKYLYFKNL